MKQNMPVKNSSCLTIRKYRFKGNPPFVVFIQSVFIKESWNYWTRKVFLASYCYNTKQLLVNCKCFFFIYNTSRTRKLIEKRGSYDKIWILLPQKELSLKRTDTIYQRGLATTATNRSVSRTYRRPRVVIKPSINIQYQAFIAHLRA